ncbi:TraG/TraD family protein [Marvinbryantia formatexigens DSM 14469]|uniref:TraG/TraD family protein n=2 Tax=Marvinbryantia TaxID=248744 RepID=C6LKN3_9FIRM|nr:TraG/TraD family protein [Marvinbryantia formatexigens DSM 14469]
MSGVHGGGNKGRLEEKASFRQGLSAYNISRQEIKVGTNNNWDTENYGGVPLDYDAKTNTVYVDGSDAHTLIIGATGSKKSRLAVIPAVHTISAAGENMIICDPKGEIYNRTAGLLEKRGYNVHAINLREPKKGDGWNLLSVPYEMFLAGDLDKACEFINDATINLMPICSKDPYWDYSARDMLFGLILLLFELCKEKHQPPELVSMQSVIKLKEALFCSVDNTIIQDTSLWNFAKRYSLIRTRLNGIVICPERTLACIISTFDQHMSCFTLQPQIIDLLSSSTFDLQSIGFGKDALYLIMPDEKSTYHKVITIFIKQIYELLIDNAFKRTSENRYPVRINFILDEFSSLPAISDFPQMIAASRSRNIRFTLVVQSKHQLRQRYDEETATIMSNCVNWIFLTSRELELLREISELSGMTGSGYENVISVSRLQHLDKDAGECLVFHGRKYPYLAMLPDIDVYDGKEYTIREMKERKNSKIGWKGYEKRDFFERLVELNIEGR